MKVRAQANTIQSDKANMRRFFLYTTSVLCFSGLVATAADRYDEWLLEQPRGSVFTLSFKQSVLFNSKIATSELGFVCDQTDKLQSAILIPFDGTFENHQEVIPVFIQKSSEQYSASDLLQKWKSGIDYIFLESQDDINALTSFLKANEADGAKTVHFFFPNALDAHLRTSNHIIVNVSGFSDGFSAFQIACGLSLK
jgi:hypothetical protein